MFRAFAVLSLCFALPLAAEELGLGLVGNFPAGKAPEISAAQIAVDAANAKSGPAGRKIKLMVFDTQGTAEGALSAVRRLSEDPSVLAALVHGEEAAAEEPAQVLADAGLAVVMASSWAAPRGVSTSATWLCPNQARLSEIAAVYARKVQKASQAAVIDNGAPTSSAAARAFARRFADLGGRVDYEGEWRGSDQGLSRTVKALKANWPQAVFFSGEGREGALLVKSLRRERELKAASLIGLPPFFDPAFVDTGRKDTKYVSAVFPSPEYKGGGQLARQVGVAFPRDTPNTKAYGTLAFRKAGRWPAMVFDGAQLLVSAVGKAPATEAPLTRGELKAALDAIPGYKGIRGAVKFSARREPVESKAMVFYILEKLSTREMRWYEKQFGPPFK